MNTLYSFIELIRRQLVASLLAASTFVVPKNCLELFSCPYSYLPKIPIICTSIQRTSSLSCRIYKDDFEQCPHEQWIGAWGLSLPQEYPVFSQRKTITAATVSFLDGLYGNVPLVISQSATMGTAGFLVQEVRGGDDTLASVSFILCFSCSVNVRRFLLDFDSPTFCQ